MSEIILILTLFRILFVFDGTFSGIHLHKLIKHVYHCFFPMLFAFDCPMRVLNSSNRFSTQKFQLFLFEFLQRFLSCSSSPWTSPAGFYVQKQSKRKQAWLVKALSHQIFKKRWIISIMNFGICMRSYWKYFTETFLNLGDVIF